MEKRVKLYFEGMEFLNHGFVDFSITFPRREVIKMKEIRVYVKRTNKNEPFIRLSLYHWDFGNFAMERVLDYCNDHGMRVYR